MTEPIQSRCWVLALQVYLHVQTITRERTNALTHITHTHTHTHTHIACAYTYRLQLLYHFSVYKHTCVKKDGRESRNRESTIEKQKARERERVREKDGRESENRESTIERQKAREREREREKDTRV